ncbi:hypothetical protein EV360DRAFT_76866 [Lentinula raphanica]|nr:hypothetical protein EV360DRAFT_76866 [Lentinula raphanica]
MTRRPTTSRTLAIVVLAASISSSVLAAPALIPPPLPFPRLSPTPFSSKAHPPQSRSVDQTLEVTMLQRRGGDHANFVLHRDGGELTIDDPGYNIDGKDATTEDMSHVEVSVSLERRTKPNSQSFHSSGSTNTGGIPPDKVQEFKSKINQELDKLHHLGRPLGVEWRRKSGDDILETLQKDKEAINALSPRMEELLNEEHVKDSSSHDRQNQQLLEYQTKLREIHDNAVKAYRRAWKFASGIPDEKPTIINRSLENYYTSTVALEKLEGKGSRAETSECLPPLKFLLYGIIVAMIFTIWWAGAEGGREENGRSPVKVERTGLKS